eukprot:gene59409-81317_t
MPPGPPALDAKGTGAGDAFGLQGKEGGADYRVGGDGSGGTGTGNRLGWYTTLLQQRAQGAVQRQRRLLEARFAITVQIWLAPDGSTERVELLRSTGRPELDRLLKDTLKNMPKLSEPPPKDLPQPAVIRHLQPVAPAMKPIRPRDVSSWSGDDPSAGISTSSGTTARSWNSRMPITRRPCSLSSSARS